jgi:hypothetical protein
MYGAIPATVDLQVTLDQAWPFIVTIPQGFRFTASGLTYEVSGAVTFAPGDVGPKAVTCREGESRNEVFVSNGAKNQVYAFPVPSGKYVAWESDLVQVGPAVWIRSPFITFEATNQYEVDYASEDPYMKFGDGVAGNVPATGDSIAADYFVTSGAAGSIGAGQTWDEVSPLIIGGNTIGMSETNPLSSGAGADRESVEHAKRTAPWAYKARTVAITKDDYIGLSKAFVSGVYGKVEQSTAYSPRSASGDVTLNALLDQIRASVIVVAEAIRNLLPGLDLDIEGVKTDLADMDALVQSIKDEVATQRTQLLNADTNIRTARGEGNSAVEGTTNVDEKGEVLKTALSGPGGVPPWPGAVDDLTPALEAALKSLVDDMKTENGGVRTSVNAIVSLLSSTTNNIQSVRDSADKIDGYGTDLLAESTSAKAHAADAEAKIAQVDTYAIQLDDDMETVLQDIWNHVDSILSDDCKANLVVVPILCVDSDGFYVAPTVGLIHVLQLYLNERCEVTQTVEVVDGSFQLVAANIEVILGVYRGYIVEEKVAEADRLLLDLLRDREFGMDLHHSEVHDAIDGIEGVDYTVVRITGPAAYLDGYGDLIVGEERVVTRGSISISYKVV